MLFLPLIPAKSVLRTHLVVLRFPKLIANFKVLIYPGDSTDFILSSSFPFPNGTAEYLSRAAKPPRCQKEGSGLSNERPLQVHPKLFFTPYGNLHLQMLKEHVDSHRDDLQHEKETGWCVSAGSILTSWCPSPSSRNQCSILKQPQATTTPVVSESMRDPSRQAWRSALHTHLLQPQPAQLLSRMSSLTSQHAKEEQGILSTLQQRLTKHTPILQSLVSTLSTPPTSVDLYSCQEAFVCLCGY